MIYDTYLVHYGVKGMKWGIRKNRKTLNSEASETKKDKAVRSLNTNKAKAEKAVLRLKDKNVKYASKVERYETTGKAKAARYSYKAEKYRQKANRMPLAPIASIMSNRASRYKVIAASITEKGEKAKSYVLKNEKTISAFEKGISSIDEILIAKGKIYAGER